MSAAGETLVAGGGAHPTARAWAAVIASGAPSAVRVRAAVAAFRALAFVLVVAGPASAQPSARLSGYAKNLAIRSRSVLSDRAFTLDAARFRLEAAVLDGPFHAEIWVDSELFAGSWFSTPEASLGADLTETTSSAGSLLDLDWRVAEGDRWRMDQRFFRATLAWYGRGVTVTAGRQRVAWGTGFVWTPTDILHPLLPTAIERDEKGGVDAVQAVFPIGTMGALEAVVAPGRRVGTHRGAARLRAHVGEYDVTLMAGRFARDFVAGTDFAGYLGDAAVRGEAALTRSAAGRWTLRATANADYTFADGVHAFVEAHHNGPGRGSVTRYDRAAQARGVLINLARWYAATGITWRASPLTVVSGHAIHNLDDGSSLLGPAVSHSIAQDLEISAGIYVFRGGLSTEYGALPDTGFFSLQFYF